MTFPRTKHQTRAGGRYDHQHRIARALAARQHKPTDPCARANDPDIRCTRPLGPMGPWLHYDHHDNTTTYRGFSHRRCNIKAAAIRGNRISRGLRTTGTPKRW